MGYLRPMKWGWDAKFAGKFAGLSIFPLSVDSLGMNHCKQSATGSPEEESFFLDVAKDPAIRRGLTCKTFGFSTVY